MCFARADDFAAMQFHRQMRGSFLFGLCIGVLLAAILFAATGLPPTEVIEALAGAAFVTTVLSGADYLIAFVRRGWFAPATN